MIIQIRSESVDNSELMSMLKIVSVRMCEQLSKYGISFLDHQVKIWIKQYSDSVFFPKVEFDINDNELQYDINRDGSINEAHFKVFVYDFNKNRFCRRDIDKSEADPVLVKIDDILRYVGY